MTNDLIGAWEVIETRAHEGVLLTVIGGSLGDFVQWTENNRLIVWTNRRKPLKYKYSILDDVAPGAIDLYSVNPKSINQAIYKLEGDELTICAASADHDRPADFSLTNVYHMIQRYRRSDAIK